MVIYFLKNKTNGMTYVGATHGDFLVRIRAHLGRYHMRNSVLSGHVKEYGKSVFEYGVIHECSSVEYAAFLEKREIEKIPEHLRYNRAVSGLPKISPTRSESVRKARLGCTATDETKKKISSSKKGVMIWGGKRVFSTEAIAKMQEARRKISLICEQNGKIYKTVAEASDDLGLKKCSVYSAASGKRSSVYGFTFKIL